MGDGLAGDRAVNQPECKAEKWPTVHAEVRNADAWFASTRVCGR